MNIGIAAVIMLLQYIAVAAYVVRFKKREGG